MRTERQECWFQASEVIVIMCIAIMVFGFASSLVAQVLGPSQDAINATLVERQFALAARLDKIESMLTYGIVGVFGTLATQLIQLGLARKKGQS